MVSPFGPFFGSSGYKRLRAPLLKDYCYSTPRGRASFPVIVSCLFRPEPQVLLVPRNRLVNNFPRRLSTPNFDTRTSVLYHFQRTPQVLTSPTVVISHFLANNFQFHDPPSFWVPSSCTPFAFAHLSWVSDRPVNHWQTLPQPLFSRFTTAFMCNTKGTPALAFSARKLWPPP